MSAIKIYDIRCKSCGAPLSSEQCEHCGSIYRIEGIEPKQDEQQDEFNRIGYTEGISLRVVLILWAYHPFSMPLRVTE